MKEFLKFKSVGGGSGDVTSAGTYYLPIDNILMCESGGLGIAIWQNAVATAGGASGGIVRYYNIELSDGTLENETAIAFNQALAANPGGKAIELQLPVGQTITSWGFQDNGII